ncbi:acyl CoA:acetate/3-ketoacid CoA transferase [Murdochiella massiliensis]|uniref:acyl CoA:acetate/3-ketoacid CoA transferase n=1 Tax=Murdochiella massiliensis TaxID=1673723 RepID=UPI00082C1A19|nr:CoA-transferase [Murdochiella massiliensis]
MAKIITLKEAVSLIKDNQTIAILGSGGGVCEPSATLLALANRYKETRSPRNLTLYHANGIGDKERIGTDCLAQEGLIKRDVAGHWAMAPKMAKLAQEEKIEAYNFPQGVLSQMYQAVASNKPGVITKTGLYTFIDPRIEGGKMNQSTKDDYVKILELDGEEWLYFPSIHFDIGLIRGTTADCNGNITYEEEAAILDGLSLAQAVHNCGGIVIAQVKYLSEHPAKAKDVVIPGIYVDYIVLDPSQQQTCERAYDPSLAGNIFTPYDSVPKLPMGARKIIARRAAKELTKNAIINLGVGIPDGISSIAQEEGYLDQLNFTVEQGIIGGMPMGGIIFGVSHNASAMIDQTAQFNFYDGGGLDCCFLGMAQADMMGNINSSKTGNLLSGCGGAINISQNAKKVVFCGTFTAKGLKVNVSDHKLNILQEGQINKFVEMVDQITFSGKYANQIEQPVLYVTERAVFRLLNGKMVLTEVAPGIELEKDILNKMQFRPEIAKDLKQMEESIFE